MTARIPTAIGANEEDVVKISSVPVLMPTFSQWGTLSPAVLREQSVARQKARSAST